MEKLERLVKHFKVWVVASVIMGIFAVVAALIAVETSACEGIWSMVAWLSVYFTGAMVGSVATMLDVKKYIKSQQGKQ